MTILRVPLRVTKPGLYRLQMHAEGAGQVVNRTALIRFLAKRPASPVWQDVRPLRIAVVRGVRASARSATALGHGYLVRGVADSALYTVVDTKFPTAAAAVVVDLGTVPAIDTRHAACAAARGEDRGTHRLAGSRSVLPERRRKRSAAADGLGGNRRQDDQVASAVSLNLEPGRQSGSSRPASAFAARAKMNRRSEIRLR